MWPSVGFCWPWHPRPAGGVCVTHTRRETDRQTDTRTNTHPRTSIYTDTHTLSSSRVARAGFQEEARARGTAGLWERERGCGAGRRRGGAGQKVFQAKAKLGDDKLVEEAAVPKKSSKPKAKAAPKPKAKGKAKAAAKTQAKAKVSAKPKPKAKANSREALTQAWKGGLRKATPPSRTSSSPPRARHCAGRGRLRRASSTMLSSVRSHRQALSRHGQDQPPDQHGSGDQQQVRSGEQRSS